MVGYRHRVSVSPVRGRVDREPDDSLGVGIDADFVPHLFEHFRQADSSSTRAHGGLGLGLALVRYLVEAHGGSVRAESEGRGRGSTFVVRLPSATQRRAQPGPVCAEPVES